MAPAFTALRQATSRETDSLLVAGQSGIQCPVMIFTDRFGILASPQDDRDPPHTPGIPAERFDDESLLREERDLRCQGNRAPAG